MAQMLKEMFSGGFIDEDGNIFDMILPDQEEEEKVQEQKEPLDEKSEGPVK